MRPARVLFLIDSLGPGGAQRQLVTLVRALDRTVVQPEVAYYHAIHHFRPELESAGIPLHDLGPGGGRDPRVAGRLTRLMRAERFDIVHTFLRTPGVLARMAAALARGSRLVVSERNVGLGDSRGRLALERALAGRADAMIVNADAIRRDLVELVPAWSGRVYVVPNGIEWAEPTDEEREAADRFREEHVGGARVLLAALGRLERQKAPDVLVEAMEALPGSQLSRARVVWVGPRIDEDLARAVERRVEEAGLGGVLTFLPETRDTRSVYMGADAVVMPSRWEGMPNVVLESLAHGTPVIATDVGDAATLVGPPEAGWLVPPEDPSALADALSEAIGTQPRKRKAMGARGAAYVLEEFSAKKLAERTVAVYERVLGGRSAAGREPPPGRQPDQRPRQRFDGRRLRVLMVGPTPPPLGGVTVLFDSLVRSMRSRDDVEVSVVDTGGVRERGAGIPVAVASLSSEVRRAARECDVLTLHAATSGLHVTGPLAASAARSAGVPLLIRKFGGTDFRTYGPVRRGLILSALRSAGVYLAETHELVEVGRELGLRAEWYPNSRDMLPLPPLGEPRPCRRFVYLGQLHSGKGIRELLWAGEQMPGNVIVDVYGTLDFDISEHQFAGLSRVRYKGPVSPENVHEVLSGYDALVLPSYHEGEGYPGVVLEAYAAGLPVVSTKWRAIPELVGHDVTGLLVTPGDAAHLRGAMLALVNDAALCWRLREGVRIRREEFSDITWHDRFVEYCRGLAVGAAKASDDDASDNANASADANVEEGESHGV